MFKTILENKRKTEKLHTAQYNIVFVNCISTKMQRNSKARKTYYSKNRDENMGNSCKI